MKRAFVILIFMALGLEFLQAQQEPMYSHYMFNGLSINPAYAGSKRYMSFAAVGRFQWATMKGAPNTQTVVFHTPSANERHGFGVTLMHDQITIYHNQRLNFSYAFRIPIKDGHLSLGVLGGASHFYYDWDDVFTLREDVAFSRPPTHLFMPEVGTGIYYHDERLFAGISAPQLLTPGLGNGQIWISDSENARRYRHFFGQAGYHVPVHEDWQLLPTLLVKWVPGLIPDFDINVAAIYRNQILFGFGYRTTHTLVGMAQWIVGDFFRLGYAFEYPTQALQGYSLGTHEILLGLDLNFKRKGAIYPRTFY